MTLPELVQLVYDLPEVRMMEAYGSATEKKNAIERHAKSIVGQVSTAYDWAFTIDVADKATVADQAEYELKGNAKDCRDIINVRLGSSSTWPVLDKKRAIDMDEFMTDRTVTGTHWWYISGRSTNGYPMITLVDTPSTTTNTIRYRYRKNKIGIGSFPDTFSPVLVAGVISRFIPAHTGVYEHELDKMVDRYSAPGGEDDPAKLGYYEVRRNNARARKFGY